jgi:DNA (cytosine-5)-methyltransferase 1
VTSALIDPRRNTAVPIGMELSPLGLLVPTAARRRRRYDRPVAVDLFSGAGGFGCGLHQAGFHVAAASEMDLAASCTYMVNLARPGVKIHTDTPERMDALAKYLDGRPSRMTESGLMLDNVAGSGWISHQPPDHPGCEHFFIYDVKNLTGAIILQALDLEPGDVTLVTGGPPCQGFSAAGKRDVMDPRNSLVLEFGRLVAEIKPKAFIMENVPPMLDMVTPEGIPVVDALAMTVAEGGYGEYDALRKALASMPGARAATGMPGHSSKKARRERKAKQREEAVDATPAAEEQLDLFDLAGGAR